VLTPVLSGGRTARDRVTMISWGDERVPARDPDAPWPGALPAPSPVVLDVGPTRSGGIGSDPRLPVVLTDAIGAPVLLTDRGRLTAEPCAAGEREIVAWAGPWLFDERWWEAAVPAHQLVAAPAGCAARIQVLCADGSALLIGFVPACGGPVPGAARWLLEGMYD
jgi:protein ImuB